MESHIYIFEMHKFFFSFLAYFDMKIRSDYTSLGWEIRGCQLVNLNHRFSTCESKKKQTKQISCGKVWKLYIILQILQTTSANLRMGRYAHINWTKA